MSATRNEARLPALLLLLLVKWGIMMGAEVGGNLMNEATTALFLVLR
jgi:hypothetical protein